VDGLHPIHQEAGVMKVMHLKPQYLVGLGAIAGRRKFTGDQLRGRHQDRGDEVNLSNDISGLLGEWALITGLEQVPGVERPEHDFWDCGKPIKGADARFRGVGYDAKSLIMAENHRYFLLDKPAVENPSTKSIDCFVPVLVREDSGAVIVGKRISPEQAQTWSDRQMRTDAPLCKARPLDQFAEECFGVTVAELHETFDADQLLWGQMRDATVTWGRALRPEEISRVTETSHNLHDGLMALYDWLGMRKEKGL